jgi:hypothetical protein
VLRRYAGQCDENPIFAVGLDDVDRRLPGWRARAGRSGREELTLQPISLVEHLQRLRKHPVAGIANSHDFLSIEDRTSRRAYRGAHRHFNGSAADG